MTSRDEWPTAGELQARSNRTEPMQIAGMPADVCPYCGAAMFVDGVNRSTHDIVRYVECRNKKCGKRFVTRQPPARLVRELGDESEPQDVLSMTGT